LDTKGSNGPPWPNRKKKGHKYSNLGLHVILTNLKPRNSKNNNTKLAQSLEN